MTSNKTVAIIASAGRATVTVRVDMCVSGAGANVPPLIVVRTRRRHGMGGYGWSTGGFKFGLHPGRWMQDIVFAK